MPGIERRLETFCAAVNAPTFCAESNPAPIRLKAQSTHVSFDNHAYLFAGRGSDRGEFADVLIHDRASQVMVPIEAKVHSDWDFEKDVQRNGERLRLIQQQM